jgi:hypothetical protein
LLRGYAGELHAGGDAELPEDVAQVEGHGVGAQEDPAGHLAVAETFGHEVGDGLLGVGQAAPAEGRPVLVGPVAQPGADGAQQGPDPGLAFGRAELVVDGVGLAQQGLRVVLIALADPYATGVFQRGGAGAGAAVAPGRLLHGGGVLPGQPAGMVSGGRHVRMGRLGLGQLNGGVGQGGRSFGVAFGQRAADQQDSAFRIGDPAAEQG